MSTSLGIDLGERRVGVAIAEGDGSWARPLTTLRRGATPADDARGLRELIDRHGVGELVVGLPLEADGREGPQSELARRWVAAIEGILGPDVIITMRDERLTSHLAETRLGPMKRGRSGGPPTKAQRDDYRARVDREAATIILQDELDARQPTRVPPAPEPRTTETSP